MAQVGDRVGAVLKSDTDTVHFLGFGVYNGRQVPPPGIGMFGLDAHELGITNPEIILDNGKKVYGCECWWGTETGVQKAIQGKRIIHVDIEQYRSEVEANG